MRSAFLLPLLAAAAVATLPSAPAAAQNRDRIVDIYGDDPCPSSNGQEIVVCHRHPRNDQYRIPQDLRESAARPQALGSSALAAVQTTGGTGTQVQSCNAIGAGVNAGCLKSQIDAARAQRRKEARDGENIP